MASSRLRNNALHVKSNKYIYIGIIHLYLYMSSKNLEIIMEIKRIAYRKAWPKVLLILSQAYSMFYNGGLVLL